MLTAWRATVLPMAIVTALPTAAQTESTPPGPVEDGNSIVVTGDIEPPTRREVFEQALEVSRVDPGRIYEEALARLTAPLCPEVVGLDRDLAREMVERIRANAERLKLRQDRGRCATNLMVVFADDGHELLAHLAESRPRAFDLIDEAERGEMLAEQAPVRVWNMVETKRAGGAPLSYRRGRPEMPSISGGPGRLFLPTRKDINFALVVYDREAVLGMTVVQLADYATMRGLSHTRPASGNEPMDTILALFEDAEGLDPIDREPAELTSFDIGYLRSVYFWTPERAVPAVGRLLGVGRRSGEAMDEAVD